MKDWKWTSLTIAAALLLGGLAAPGFAADDNNTRETATSPDAADDEYMQMEVADDEQEADEDYEPAPAGPTLREPPTAEKDWKQEIKEPVDWFKWGADLRLREIWADNIITLSKSGPNSRGHERHFQRYRGRLWGTVTPVEDLHFNARLVYEPRHICRPEFAHNWAFNEALFDQLNVTWDNAGGLPLKVVAGRQDIIHGNGWLVLEGTPLDGSRTIFFDGIRAIYQLEDADTTIDAAFVENRSRADAYIEPFGDDEQPLAEDDSRGAILYVTNKSIERTQVDGYFIWKRDLPQDDDEHKAVFPPVWAQDADIYTFGSRVVHDFNDHWKARGEFAVQTGQKNGRDLCAMGFNSRVTYFLKDKLNNNFRFAYEYLSGDDPSTGDDEAFDPLWGRWPQWSELFIYTMARETRIAGVTNLHRLGFGWSMNPTEKIELCTDYHLLFADENPRGGSDNGFSRNGCFRGQLVSALMRYKFTENIYGHLLGEFFFPGDYYDETMNDPALFLRYEISFKF